MAWVWVLFLRSPPAVKQQVLWAQESVVRLRPLLPNLTILSLPLCLPDWLTLISKKVVSGLPREPGNHVHLLLAFAAVCTGPHTGTTAQGEGYSPSRCTLTPSAVALSSWKKS